MVLFGYKEIPKTYLKLKVKAMGNFKKLVIVKI